MGFVAAASRAVGRVLLALMLTSSFATLAAMPLAAAELPVGATLSIIASPVEIAANGTDLFAEAAQGQLVQPGDVVRTGSGGIAVLTFFDGSESQLASDSQIQLQRADYAPAPNIALMQSAGVTVNRVIPLPPGGSFETDTPSAIGLVRGTSYVVCVAPAGPEVDAAVVSSLVLLTDRDGHVGHVQVTASGSSAVVDLTRAGDVGATVARTAAAAHLAPAALAEMEQSARDLHDGQSAQVSAVHARGVVDAVAPLLGGSAPSEKSAAAAATELAEAPKTIDRWDSSTAGHNEAASSDDGANASRPDDSREPTPPATRPATHDVDDTVKPSPGADDSSKASGSAAQQGSKRPNPAAGGGSAGAAPSTSTSSTTTAPTSSPKPKDNGKARDDTTPPHAAAKQPGDTRA